MLIFQEWLLIAFFFFIFKPTMYAEPAFSETNKGEKSKTQSSDMFQWNSIWNDAWFAELFCWYWKKLMRNDEKEQKLQMPKTKKFFVILCFTYVFAMPYYVCIKHILAEKWIIIAFFQEHQWQKVINKNENYDFK